MPFCGHGVDYSQQEPSKPPQISVLRNLAQPLSSQKFGQNPLLVVAVQLPRRVKHSGNHIEKRTDSSLGSLKQQVGTITLTIMGIVAKIGIFIVESIIFMYNA